LINEVDQILLCFTSIQHAEADLVCSFLLLADWFYNFELMQNREKKPQEMALEKNS
jgi:hypothetical protein